MNELEKYKNELAEKTWDDNHVTEKRAVRQGFDAAIGLSLPVKFAKFIRKYVRQSTTNNYMWNWKGVLYTDEQLYQYWIDNVFKINQP